MREHSSEDDIPLMELRRRLRARKQRLKSDSEIDTDPDTEDEDHVPEVESMEVDAVEWIKTEID